MSAPGPARAGRALAVGVLASGAGTLLEALVARTRSDPSAPRFVLVLTDRAEAPVRERARRLGIPDADVGRPRGDGAAWSEDVDRRLRDAGADAVLLDGFLSRVPAPFLPSWAGRIFNVHPSLLPRHGGPGFYGARVHEAVLAAGDRETGVTVHEVVEALDAGPIRAQRRLPVLPDDTPERLRERLRPLEVEAVLAVLATVRPRPDRSPPTGRDRPRSGGP